MPERFKLQPGRIKPLLADALPLPLPEAIRGLKKRGFTLPVNAWLKRQMAASFERYVLDKENEAFWDLDLVSGLWSAYRMGRVSWGVVWNLYAFARWVKDHRESL